MKKLVILTLALVLTAALFTGCGCTSQDAQYTTVPTTRPTTAATVPSTQPTTQATTESTTEATADRGNGPLENSTGAGDTTDSTEDSGTARSRRMEPTMR